MKGMPGLYYSTGGGGESRPPRWVGSVLYMDADTAEARRLYDREDATPLPTPEANVPPPRTSLAAFFRRIVGTSGAAT